MSAQDFASLANGVDFCVGGGIMIPQHRIGRYGQYGARRVGDQRPERTAQASMHGATRFFDRLFHHFLLIFVIHMILLWSPLNS